LDPVKVAVAGLSPTGERYLNILQQSECFEVCAVADVDAARLRRLDPDGRFGVYEDYRSLVLEASHAGLDVVVVALEPFQARDLLPLAADQGIAVFHQTPFARTVREGRQIVERFERCGVPLVVAREWSHFGLPCAASDRLHHPEHIYLVNADIRVACHALDWRGDAARAGGGVLLNGAYDVVDWLVAGLGLPEAVYAVCGYAQVPGTTRSYDTEDHVAMVLRLSGDRSATVTVRRSAQEYALRMTIVGTNGTFIHTAEASAQATDDQIGADADVELLTQIGDAAAPVTGKPSGAREHLSALSVIEAAYLSARTGSPEVPSRFLP